MADEYKSVPDESGSSIAIGTPITGGTNGSLLYISPTGNLASPANPGADRIAFFDFSAGQMAWLTIGSGLDITGTTLSSTDVGGTVTSVAWTTSQGVSASIATPTTTPNITITLGALTGVTSLNGLVVTPNTGVITTGTFRGTVLEPAYGGTGIANNAASTLTISGNFATTLTVSGITTVTLPTTGTLATLAGAETFTNKVSYNGLVITANTGAITTGTWSATAIGATVGGTGQTVYAVGDLLSANTTTTLSKVADVATGSILVSGGVGALPAWSASPTITTSITTPLHIGGTAVGSTLALQGTSGNGTSTVAAINLNVGNNGATTALSVYNTGKVTAGLLAAPTAIFTSAGNGNGAAGSGANANSQLHIALITDFTVSANNAARITFNSGGGTAAHAKIECVRDGFGTFQLGTTSDGGDSPIAFLQNGAETGRFAHSTLAGNFYVGYSVSAGTVAPLTIGGAYPKVGAYKSQNAPTIISVENPNTGTTARSGFWAYGADLFHYAALACNGANFTGTANWANRGVLQFGGLMDGAIIYADDGDLRIGVSSTFPTDIYISPLSIAGVTQTDPVPGSVGIGTTSVSAHLTIAAGTTAAKTAPLKLISGTLMTTAEAGVGLEYNGSFYQTKGSALRYGLGGVIFNYFADVPNVTTTETDLFTNTLPASILAVNGESIYAEYTVTTLGSATATTQNRLYFGGTLIYDSGALGLSTAADFKYVVTVDRTSSSEVRCTVTAQTTTATAAPYVTYTKITGLTLTNTQILKITGTRAGVGAASADINGVKGKGWWFAAANL